MTQGKPEPSDGSLRGPHSLLPPPEGVHRASGAHQGLKLEVKGTRPPLTSPLCPSPRPRPTCCGVLSTPRGGGQELHQKPPNIWILLHGTRPEVCHGNPGLAWFTHWALVRTKQIPSL